ncbi:prephenate dehydratase [Mycoemilia scoparia]|uniref:Bifunctional chorismate mutase/prephenate dehydratase n=1 Tax=Mycoemilia scoparia TaxID=417184 RepID=A0A9W7ZUK9_9FUNG|nr:prephenate dehydratase [Mycoemilia scoparia]
MRLFQALLAASVLMFITTTVNCNNKSTVGFENSRQENMDLEKARLAIASVDRQLVDLLNERARMSLDVAAAKRKSTTALLPSGQEKGQQDQGENAPSDVYVPGQEKKVFNRVMEMNNGPLSDDSVIAIYREIMSASISLQSNVSIGYLGPKGTFTHEAAMKRFGESVAYFPFKTIDDVIEAVVEDKTTYGVIPIENSANGIVVQTLDALAAHQLPIAENPNIRIKGEIYLPVTQCLMSRYQLSAIHKVYSHPQALGQSKKWLDTHLPGVPRVDVDSTAKAAELASAEVSAAAVGNKICATLYGLELLAEGINTDKENTTRFFVISKAISGDGGGGEPTGDDKSFLMFTVDHRQPGALIKALEAFALNNINMTSMNSRPSGQRKWQYIFFVEIEGHKKDPNVEKALQMMAPYCLDLLMLGSYPVQKS